MICFILSHCHTSSVVPSADAVLRTVPTAVFVGAVGLLRVLLLSTSVATMGWKHISLLH